MNVYRYGGLHIWGVGFFYSKRSWDRYIGLVIGFLFSPYGLPIEQLSELKEITYRSMMGEYIVYYRGKIVGEFMMIGFSEAC